MIRASATGCLDYSDADSTDDVWLAREGIMLRYAESAALIELMKLRQQQQIATSSWAGDTDGEVWRDHFNAGREHMLKVGALLFPWVSWDERKQRKNEIDELRDEYTKRFGDPSSPEAKEQDKRDKEALKRSQLDAKQQAQAKSQAESDVAASMKRIRDKRNKRS